MKKKLINLGQKKKLKVKNRKGTKKKVIIGTVVQNTKEDKRPNQVLRENSLDNKH